MRRITRLVDAVRAARGDPPQDLAAEIEREYEQVEAAVLLNSGLFIEAQISGRKPAGLAEYVAEFLRTRAE